MLARLLVIAAFVLVLALPFAVRWSCGSPPASPLPSTSAEHIRTLVIATPHVEQIRDEFARAFSAWHQRHYHEPVRIDWRTPGGTSDIIKLLEAQFAAAASAGRIDEHGIFEPGVTGFDILMGGGSYEHAKLKDTRTAGWHTYRLSVPADFSNDELLAAFAPPGTPRTTPPADYNHIGVQNLFDPEQYWLGTALSSFGIVYNREVVASLGLPSPTSFTDLTDARYRNMLALADPRQSGSVTTTYESILNNEGWNGWDTLRAMCANARYFASSSTRPPIDVSQGDAAAGLAIDFYGRGQAQAIMQPGETAADAHVGYADPAGAVYVDADPATILNGATDLELAKRFMHFCLSEEAQALWQLPAISSDKGRNNPPNTEDKALQLGPARYELRRMPISPAMYEPNYFEHFVDHVNPFEIASNTKSRNWRGAIAPLMAAFGIDTADELRSAWSVYNDAIDAGTLSKEEAAEIRSLIFAMPIHRTRPGCLTAVELKSLSKDASGILAKAKLHTIAEIDAYLAKSDAAKLAPEITTSLRALVDARLPVDRDAVLDLPFNEANFALIKFDTDSWKDPVHGRRTLIAYTEFFRDHYSKAERLARKR